MPETNPPQVCKDETCPNYYANSREGRTWAYSEGWYISKDHLGRVSSSYCPHHVPEWVGRWRNRIKQVDF
jgi:hypothetical protein